jgi:response regulator RpfG family c-di-GMP phosphodiesterase
MATPARKPRVLLVDDEPMVLDGLVLHLRRKYDVVVATSGRDGLAAMEKEPFAVVVSDMRMPGMDGAEFLSLARASAPETVRVLLTGHADFEVALAAVNHGQIFRFLTKPCPVDIVLSTVAAGAEQNRLVNAERVLLSQTLAGSVKALTDLLALANPIAFGRAGRLRRTVGKLCDRLGVADRWHIDVAAQLSQIGCISLPPALAEKLYYGQPLAPAEQELAQKVPELADQLLGNIPRLEPVREILGALRRRWDGADDPYSSVRGEAIPLGARMLRIAMDLDDMEASGLSSAQAMAAMQDRAGTYDPRLLEAVAADVGDDGSCEVRELPVPALKPGMVLMTDVWSRTGVLLVARGYTVSDGLIQRLKNLAPGVREPIRVSLPRA